MAPGLNDEVSGPLPSDEDFGPTVHGQQLVARLELARYRCSAAGGKSLHKEPHPLVRNGDVGVDNVARGLDVDAKTAAALQCSCTQWEWNVSEVLFKKVHIGFMFPIARSILFLKFQS